MNENAKTDLDIEEQMQRIRKTELDMMQTKQAMKYATAQLFLSMIGTAVASIGAVLAAIKLLYDH